MAYSHVLPLTNFQLRRLSARASSHNFVLGGYYLTQGMSQQVYRRCPATNTLKSPPAQTIRPLTRDTDLSHTLSAALETWAGQVKGPARPPRPADGWFLNTVSLSLPLRNGTKTSSSIINDAGNSRQSAPWETCWLGGILKEKLSSTSLPHSPQRGLVNSCTKPAESRVTWTHERTLTSRWRCRLWQKNHLQTYHHSA